MSSKERSEVKLITESFIRPKHELEPSKQVHYLGPIDLYVLPPSFKDSLSVSLLHFYPLAGQFTTQKFPNEHASSIYVDCIKGPGAGLLHASVDMTLQDGMFIGFTMNHSTGDGTSLWHFISSLSEIFLQLHNGKYEDSLSVSKKRIYGPILPEGYDRSLKLPYLEPEEFVFQFEPGPLRERIFHFSSTAITKLKTKAQSWGWEINPPLSEAQFGNVIIMALTSCKIAKLLGQDLGWAAKLINRGIMMYDDKRIRECVSSIVKAPHVAQTSPEFASYMRNNLWIGGSMRFDMYGPEFGLGPAVAVLAGFANKHDGKVVANPGCDGGGTVDLEVCLEPNVMDALELDGEFMSFVSSN
ncbi:hypothetical protein Cgig2_006520 [Carnegiea gigantea]|uniref:Uncharacterized protein n=1 Tax=Carnegiea gigantea TaxID=171969 RepID=A0A9Q1H042_9CARY|nr:hypothetical protein Cgig2_006520 [Carnegiea gigantea]